MSNHNEPPREVAGQLARFIVRESALFPDGKVATWQVYDRLMMRLLCLCERADDAIQLARASNVCDQICRWAGIP